MPRFIEGDRVRIDIPDEADPDHDLFHGRHGTVLAFLGRGGPRARYRIRDGAIYRLELDAGTLAIFAQSDLRPAFK